MAPRWTPSAEATSVICAEQSRYRIHRKPKLGGRRLAELLRRDIRMFMWEMAANTGMSPSGWRQ